MEQIILRELKEDELYIIGSGGFVSDAVMWFLGACFITPGKTALDGHANDLFDY